MGCMKCGRDTSEDQMFCIQCQEVMRRYPVKPGIAVQLPSHKENHHLKRPAPQKRRSGPAPEDLIRRLRKQTKTFFILWLVTLMLLATTIYPTVEYFFGRHFHLPGQNYSTFTSQTDTEP